MKTIILNDLNSNITNLTTVKNATMDFFNKNERELEDKNYAIKLTEMTFKVSEATKSNEWIEI